MAVAGTLEIQMLANMARLSKDMSEAKGMVGGAMKSIESSVASAKKVLGALGIGVSIAGMISFAKAVVEAASQAEQASNRLNATIKATGDTSGFTREQLDKMTDALTRATTFDDESIRNAQANLMKFGALHGQTFERALKLSADYAAFMGTDMVAATQLIGKALADPEKGVTQLGKALGTLTAEQEASIKKFMEQGKIAEAQEVIFGKLEKSIGGTAGAMNTGLFGATTAATKAWDELMESMGKTGAVKLVVESSLSVVTNLLGAMKEYIEGINKETQQIIARSQGTLQKLTPAQGGPPLREGQLDIPDMSIQEVAAAGRANIAKREAEESARAAAANENAAKAAREHTKAIQDKMKWLAAGVESQERYNKAIEDAIEAGDKETARIRDSALAMDQMIADLAFMNDQDRAATIEKKRSAEETGLESLRDSLMTEDELRKFAYESDFNLLNDTLGMKKEAQEEYYTLMGRLVRQNIENQTALEDAAIKKRFGIANVYRKLDLDSAGFFADQMAGLMTTKSRELFEIGKAAAIAGAIVDTYKAATGAYAALASIPVVGPALGAAAATAAVLVGMARVQAISSTTMGGGGAVGTFSASPTTGLPESPSAGTASGSGTTTIINLQGETFGRKQVQDLIEQINEQTKDGGRLILA